MLLSLKNIVKYRADRCLLKIASLKIHEGEKIGIIGRNGVGKSTLFGILAGTIQPDEGEVNRYCLCSYVPQLDADSRPAPILNRSLAGQLAGQQEYSEIMSGGEKTRYRLAVAFSEDRPLLLADEPAANLDISGTTLLQAKLQSFRGTLILVSHDRRLINEVCNVIWEIEEGRLRVYQGNYRQFLSQKENEKKNQQREYEKYRREKHHLEQAVRDRNSRSSTLRKTPKRMGNSEARLHKMGNQKAKANLDKAVKALETRLAKLERREKPKAGPAINFALNSADGLGSKIVIRGQEINKNFGRRVLFRNAEFSIFNGQKVALFGDNGCGKTTLLKMVIGGEEGIYVSPAARIGYFAQDMADLEPDQSILANIMATSVRTEGFIRQLLAQLLFRRDDIYKRVGILSGGERVRVCLARIMASEANLLLLDEPTNYLDLPAREALESVLAEYDGTILFASHDREFIDRIATRLMVFSREGVRLFTGNYEQYRQEIQAEKDLPGQLSREERILLEYRLTAVVSRLSLAKDQGELAGLDEEYRRLLRQIKK